MVWTPKTPCGINVKSFKIQLRIFVKKLLEKVITILLIQGVKTLQKVEIKKTNNTLPALKYIKHTNYLTSKLI